MILPNKKITTCVNVSSQQRWQKALTAFLDQERPKVTSANSPQRAFSKRSKTLMARQSKLHTRNAVDKPPFPAKNPLAGGPRSSQHWVAGEFPRHSSLKRRCNHGDIRSGGGSGLFLEGASLGLTPVEIHSGAKYNCSPRIHPKDPRSRPLS